MVGGGGAAHVKTPKRGWVGVSLFGPPFFTPPLLDSTLGYFQADRIGAMGRLSGVNREVVVDGRVGGQYHCASCHPVLIRTLHPVALVFVHKRLLEDLAAHSGNGGS